MVIGISSFTYGWSVETNPATGIPFINEMDLILMAVEQEISCLQIGDNMPLHLMSRDRLTKFRKAAADKNIRLETGARGLTPEHLRKYIELASFLKSPILRFVVDDGDYAPDKEDTIAIIRDVLPELLARGIYLGIENHDRLKSRELAQIIDSINHDHVGICLDCVNSIGAGEGLEQVLDYLVPHTINLHFKDFIIKRLSHKMGFIVEGAIPGHGFLNTKMVFDRLSKYNRCQSVILEQWVPPEKELNNTVKKEQIWAIKGIEFLKDLSYFK